jgi:putative FmdB family regulatory protein
MMRRMPIYEYRCDGCARAFEELVPASGAAEVRCPDCSSTTVTKLFSQFAATRSGDAVSVGGGGCCGGSCGCC